MVPVNGGLADELAPIASRAAVAARDLIQERSDRCMADELEECKDRNRQLEEENELLREAAETFGELADRLNERLQEQPEPGAADATGAREPHQE